MNGKFTKKEYFIASILGIIYSILLYVFAATASLRNTYQPGIENLHITLNPNNLTILVIGTILLVKKRFLVKVSVLFLIFAIIISIVLTIFVSTYQGSIGEWVLPENRTLLGTVKRSVFEPVFSGRSTARTTFSGICAVIGYGLSCAVLRRRYTA